MLPGNDQKWQIVNPAPTLGNKIERARLSILIRFSPFFIGDGRAGSIAGLLPLHHICYWTLLERCNTLIPDALLYDTAELC